MDAQFLGYVIFALSAIVSLYMTFTKPVVKTMTDVTEKITALITKVDYIEKEQDNNKDGHTSIHRRIDDVSKDLNEFKVEVSTDYQKKNK